MIHEYISEASINYSTHKFGCKIIQLCRYFEFQCITIFSFNHSEFEETQEFFLLQLLLHSIYHM